jgi:hypothetical protein
LNVTVTVGNEGPPPTFTNDANQPKNERLIVVLTVGERAALFATAYVFVPFAMVSGATDIAAVGGGSSKEHVRALVTRFNEGVCRLSRNGCAPKPSNLNYHF